MNVDRWRGIHTILITPFKPDFSLDLDGHRQNVRFAAESRAHVLVCLGTQGEFSSLSVEERRAVMRVTVEETQGRKPVICGVGSSSTLEAVALSRHARELGADAVMAVPPYFAEVTTEGVVDHFRRIVTDARIPLFLYNAPARAGFNLTPQLLERLATIDGIVGVKQATRNVTELEETVALVGLRMAVIGGAEAMIWPALALGMIGSTSTAASFMPDPMTAIYDAAVAGRMGEGIRRYYEQSEFRAISKVVGHAAAVKVGMDLVGLAGGPVRPPLQSPSPDQRGRIVRIIEDLGVKPVK